MISVVWVRVPISLLKEIGLTLNKKKMSKEKENKAFDPEDLLNATISEEGFALVKKVITEELDDPNVNKEAISNVVESLKDQSNITLFRLIETLLLLIPFELTVPEHCNRPQLQGKSSKKTQRNPREHRRRR